jgi:small subunit ribosomal protein S17e
MNDGVIVCNPKWRIIMGNIRPGYIKSLGHQLLEEHSDVFTTDFNQNKENVTKYTTIESKGIRNRVAGYIVRQLKVKAIRKR